MSYNKTNNSKLLPIGVQSFEKIREGNYLYVDKTDLIYKLVTEGAYYFLSRPRRFGKSLLISTLDCYFSGKKQLFKELKIEKLEKEWKKYPVFHFDLSGENFTSPESLENKLSVALEEKEDIYGRDKRDTSLSLRFQRLLKNACKKTGLQSVILVDEYDKPMLDSIDNEKLNKDLRDIFKGFFGTIKGMDDYIKFAFFTGITKLRNVSIFSDLNNLGDISLDDEYSSLCGITKEELLYYFDDRIGDMSTKNKTTKEETVEKLKAMYDGYHFSDNLVDIYNPFSLLNAFRANKTSSYWFGQTMPSFLVNRLQKGDWDLYDYDNGKLVISSLLGEIGINDKDPTPLLYQAGYLTIKRYDEKKDMFSLSFPNGEIRNGFLNVIMPYLLSYNATDEKVGMYKIHDALEKGNVESLLDNIASIFSNIPYCDLKINENEKQKLYEREYRNTLTTIFMLLGDLVFCESHTSDGRIDQVVVTDSYIYIFEFKRDSTPEEALEQINRSGYADPYLNNKRKVIKVGVNFSSDKRNIDGYLIG